MWKWLRKRGERSIPAAESVLSGVPRRPRSKTYSAETGYVYQYVFRGHRRSTDNGGTEFVFDVSRDRRQTFSISILLLDRGLVECETRIGRTLPSPERYALAKMALFKVFNEQEDTTTLAVPVAVTSDFMEETLRALGRIE